MVIIVIYIIVVVDVDVVWQEYDNDGKIMIWYDDDDDGSGDWTVPTLSPKDSGALLFQVDICIGSIGFDCCSLTYTCIIYILV